MVKSRYPVLDATGTRGYQRKQPIDQRRCRDWLLPFMRSLSYRRRTVMCYMVILMSQVPIWFC
jgi:hypothetical protein